MKLNFGLPCPCGGSLFFSVNASADPLRPGRYCNFEHRQSVLGVQAVIRPASRNKALNLCVIDTHAGWSPACAIAAQLDGPAGRVVQRGNEISYFEPGLEAFTLNSDYIVDSLPSLIYTDFKRFGALLRLYFCRTHPYPRADCAKLSALWRAMVRVTAISSGWTWTQTTDAR